MTRSRSLSVLQLYGECHDHLCWCRQICFYDFDSETDPDNILLVRNGNVLEKRSMKSSWSWTMELEHKVSLFAMDRNISFSSDGKFCAMAGGNDNESWYLIEIPYQLQYKMTSESLENSFAPTFIGKQWVFIGGKGRFEIWSLEHLSSIKTVSLGDKWVNCACSRGDLLALGCSDNTVSIFDTRCWEIISQFHLILMPQSVHLSHDLRFLTVSGESGERCIVLQIK